MLKHMPDKELETYENTLLYSKRPVKLPNNNSRGLNNNSNTNNRTDDNLTDPLDKFSNLISRKKIYRIPLRYLVDFGLVNFPIACGTMFIFTLEQNMNKLFESNAKVNPVPEPSAKIIIYEAPFISYPQIKLNKNFKVYFNSTLTSKKPCKRKYK